MKKEKDEMVFVAEPEEAVETAVEKVVAEPIYEGTVTAKMLAVRQSPSQASLMIRVLYKDDKISYERCDDDWYALIDGGFVMSKFVQ